MFWARDAETGEQIWVDSGDASLRQRYAEQALAQRQRLAQVVQRAGMDGLELSTHEDLGDALLRFVQLRQLKQRHA